MDKTRIKQLQAGHREAAHKSAHPVWQINRGDQGVRVVRTQPETATRQDQEENKVELTAASPWDLDKMLRRTREHQQRLEEQKRKVQELGKNNPVQAPASQAPAKPTHDDATRQKRKLERERAKTKPVTEATPTTPTTPTTPKQERETKQFDEAKADEDINTKVDPNPDKLVKPEEFKVNPSEQTPEDRWNNYINKGNTGGGPLGWVKEKFRQFTEPDHDLLAAQEQIKRMPDRDTLKAWAISYMPKPDDVDKIVNDFLTKAGRTDLNGSPKISVLREKYGNYARDIHSHRLRYIEYLLNDMFKQKSQIRRAEHYRRFKSWVTRQQLNDAVKVAIFQALNFLTENSKRLMTQGLDEDGAPVEPAAPKIAFEILAAISNPFQAAQDLTDITYYLKVMQGLGVDISDQNKVIQRIGRLKNGAVLQQAMQRLIQAHGSWAEVLETYEWASQAASEQGVSMQEAVQEITQAQQPTAPQQQIDVTHQGPSVTPDDESESYGMDALETTAQAQALRNMVPHLSTLSDQQIAEFRDMLSELSDDQYAQLDDVSQAIEAELAARQQAQGNTQYNKQRMLVERLKSPIEKLRIQPNGDDPYILGLDHGQLMRHYLMSNRTEPAQPGDSETYTKVEQAIAVLPKAQPAKPVKRNQPFTVPPKRQVQIPHTPEEMQQQLHEHEPDTKAVDEAQRRLRPDVEPEQDPTSQIPSAPLTPEPEKLMRSQEQAVDEGMDDIGSDEVTEMLREIDHGQPSTTTTPGAPPTPAQPVQNAIPVTQPVSTTTRPRQPLQIEKDYGFDTTEPPKPPPPPPEFTPPPSDADRFQKMEDEVAWIAPGDAGGFMTLPSGKQLQVGDPLFMPSQNKPGTTVQPYINVSPKHFPQKQQRPFIGMGVINNAMVPSLKEMVASKPGPNGKPLSGKELDQAAFRLATGYITGYWPSSDKQVMNTWIRVYHPFIDEEHGGITFWAPLSYYEEDRNRTIIGGGKEGKVYQHPYFGQPGYPGHDKDAQQIQQPMPMQTEVPAGTPPQNPMQPGVAMADSGTIQAPTVTTSDQSKGTANQMANNGQMPQPDVQSSGQAMGQGQTNGAPPAQTIADPNQTLTIKAPTGQEMKVKLASDYSMNSITEQ